MQQQTFTDIEYSRRKKKTRREEFLDTMDQMPPLERLDRSDRALLSIRETRQADKRNRDHVPHAELVQSFRCSNGRYDL